MSYQLLIYQALSFGQKGAIACSIIAIFGIIVIVVRYLRRKDK